MSREIGASCLQCGKPMKAGRGDWKGFELPGVILVDIPVYVCPKCGETERGVQSADGLERAIAGALINKPERLTPEEIRHLRNRLELSGADFAKHMGTTPETVSRWENGAVPMGQVSDRLLRAMVALHHGPSSGYRVELFKDVARLKAKPLRLALRYVPGKGWLPESRRKVA